MAARTTEYSNALRVLGNPYACLDGEPTMRMGPMLQSYLPQFQMYQTEKEKTAEMLRAKEDGLEGKPASVKQLYKLKDKLHKKYHRAA